MKWIDVKNWNHYKEWEKDKVSKALSSYNREKNNMRSIEKYNNEPIEKVARDIVYDGWTWNTISVLSKEEHKQLDKYIEQFQKEKDGRDL